MFFGETGFRALKALNYLRITVRRLFNRAKKLTNFDMPFGNLLRLSHSPSLALISINTFSFQIVGIISVFFICVSIVSFCLKTHPDMRVPVIRNITVKKPDGGIAWTLDKTQTNAHEFFFYIECICNGWFTFEILVSELSCFCGMEIGLRNICLSKLETGCEQEEEKDENFTHGKVFLEMFMNSLGNRSPGMCLGRLHISHCNTLFQQIRFISSPSKCEFIMSFVNIIDYIATASFL